MITYSAAISNLIFAMAVPGCRPLGHVREPTDWLRNWKLHLSHILTIKNGVAPIQAERVLQFLFSLCTVRVLRDRACLLEYL